MGIEARFWISGRSHCESKLTWSVPAALARNSGETRFAENHPFNLSGSRQIHSKPHGRPSGQECRLRLKPPTPHSVGPLDLNPQPLRALAPTASFRGPQSYRFAFGKKIWHTIFFSSKATFKIFLKLLPKPGALRLRKTRPLWFFRVIRCGTPYLARWQRIRRTCSDSSLWFAQSYGPRVPSGTTAIPSTAFG